MKILHTSDWHLGKFLERFSRIDEQIEFLEELITIVDTHQVDLILIAGDLFDNFNPPTKAVEVFYKYLKKLTNYGKRSVVAIAGNHDSPDRIEAPDPLARECGIIFLGYPESTPGTYQLETGVEVSKADTGFLEIILSKYSYPLRLIATSYANETRLKKYLPIENREQEFRDCLQTFWQGLSDKYCDNKGVNILVSHLYMEKKGSAPPLESESEKKIVNLQGSEKLFTDNLPSNVSYVALGHLHRYQVISEKPCPVVYSGSPIAYSLSESEQPKYVVLIDMEPKKKAKFEKLQLKSGKKILRRKFDDIQKALEWVRENTDSYIELTIKTDTFLSAKDTRMLYEVHDKILSIIPESSSQVLYTDSYQQEINLQKKIDELFIDYFKFKNAGLNPSETILELFQEVLSMEKQ
jgi:DNA repair protein SbcD/Mre11